MTKAIENLLSAQKFALSVRPKVGGFPFLAEALRKTGVTRNLWQLPSCQSVYYTRDGVIVTQGAPLFMGNAEVPQFDQQALVRALRVDQSGESTFPEFLKSVWEAGVVTYDVNFEERKVTYFGALGESYSEDYKAVEVVR